MSKLCIKCNEKPVEIKKRQLCKRCYQQNYIAGDFGTLRAKENIEHKREMQFAESFFDDPDDYIYEPAMFSMGGVKYTPDFYWIDENIFFEIVGSRQAYHLNKHKYSLFRYYFPHLVLELRAPCGTLIEEEAVNKNLKWPASVNNGGKNNGKDA